jgi:23S rRNA (cytidine1920-2'-O)/16S rRNA (cytidine1409-2'-O)-methyltransferase
MPADLIENMVRERLDSALVVRGLVRSRSHGRDLIRRGFVTVDGAVERRASRPVNVEHKINLREDAPNFVSRGAEKLLAALDHFGFECADLSVIDIGASTGGFTEVLLERGAREVFAVDVGRGQLDASLLLDPRVHNLEGVDARRLGDEHVGQLVDALVCDLSFISVRKALTGPLLRVRRGGWAIVLAKPQFEAGPGVVDDAGVVRDEALREELAREVAEWLATQAGWRVVGITPSPIAGGSGNAEYLIGARRDG